MQQLCNQIPNFILPDGDVKFINVPNCQGKTPLELAKTNGNTEIHNQFFLQNLKKLEKKTKLEIPLE